MAADNDNPTAKTGRMLAKLIAGTGIVYIVVQLVAAQYEWPHRMMALFDLAALAVFGYALWLTIKLWRNSRETDGKG